MYLHTLSQTAENILAFLLNNLERSYSIREIASSVGQDYKIVYTTTQALARARLVELKRVANLNQCTICLAQENAALFGFISERLAARRLPKRVWNALQDAIASIKDPFYVLLVFGSYAKGFARPTSDIDVLLIAEEKKEEVEAAIQKASTLNNLKINHLILTEGEFTKGLREESVAREAYKKHYLIKGGESFYMLIGHA